MSIFAQQINVKKSKNMTKAAENEEEGSSYLLNDVMNFNEIFNEILR